MTRWRGSRAQPQRPAAATSNTMAVYAVFLVAMLVVGGSVMLWQLGGLPVRPAQHITPDGLHAPLGKEHQLARFAASPEGRDEGGALRGAAPSPAPPALPAVHPPQASPVAEADSSHGSSGAGAMAAALEPALPVVELEAAQVPQAAAPVRARQALVFTMDTIAAYGAAAAKGGPAGEILVTSCLVAGLRHLGWEVTVAASDEEFFSAGEHIGDFEAVFVDPWTVFGPGYTARPFLVGKEARTFVLDFFGAPGLGHGGLGISPAHLLTAYDVPPWNTYLGFFLPPSIGAADHSDSADARRAALAQGAAGLTSHGWVQVPRGWRRERASATAPQHGVLWGKKTEYFASSFAQRAVPAAAAVGAGVRTTAAQGPPWMRTLDSSGRLQRTGHLQPAAWHALLADSAYLLALGDPLAGPSALEAVALGAGYVDVQYGTGRGPQGVYGSQHPFVAAHVPEEYLCTVPVGDPAAVQGCAEQFVGRGGLHGFLPTALTPMAYLDRLRGILELLPGA